MTAYDAKPGGLAWESSGVPFLRGFRVLAGFRRAHAAVIVKICMKLKVSTSCPVSALSRSGWKRRMG